MDALQRIKKVVLEKIDILEEEFKIKIPDREVTTVTIQDVVNVIDKLAAE